MSTVGYLFLPTIPVIHSLEFPGPAVASALSLSIVRPFFTPTESAPPAIKEKIWSRVLFFAMYVDEFENGFSMGHPFHLSKLNKKCLLVSMMFKVLSDSSFNLDDAHLPIKRLAILFLYGYPILATSSALNGFAESYIRSLSFVTPDDDDTTRFIFSAAPHLRKLAAVEKYVPYSRPAQDIWSFPAYDLEIVFGARRHFGCLTL